MIDQTNLEQQAFGAALKPLAEAVTEIGKSKPLEHYTRDEILRLNDTLSNFKVSFSIACCYYHYYSY